SAASGAPPPRKRIGRWRLDRLAGVSLRVSTRELESYGDTHAPRTARGSSSAGQVRFEPPERRPCGAVCGHVRPAWKNATRSVGHDGTTSEARGSVDQRG